MRSFVISVIAILVAAGAYIAIGYSLDSKAAEEVDGIDAYGIAQNYGSAGHSESVRNNMRDSFVENGQATGTTIPMDGVLVGINRATISDRYLYVYYSLNNLNFDEDEIRSEIGSASVSVGTDVESIHIVDGMSDYPEGPLKPGDKYEGVLVYDLEIMSLSNIDMVTLKVHNNILDSDLYEMVEVRLYFD